MSFCRTILAATLLSLTLMLAGCASSTSTKYYAAMPGRSLVLDSPQLHALVERSTGNALPWYASRNDVKTSVTLFGSTPSAYHRSYSDTYNQLSLYEGQIYNNFSQTTYRKSETTTPH